MTAPNDTEIRANWEQRATENLEGVQGVLLQGLPQNINQALSDWQAVIITTKLAQYLPSNPYVLDIAAGYGRLSKIVRSLRPNAKLVGMDFSLTYSRLYTKTGSAVCADMRQLPFAPKCWDGVLLATGLMYLDTESAEVAVQQVLAGLKPGGVALFIEPGAEMMSLLGKLRPKPSTSTTGGRGFGLKEYRRLFQHSGYRIVGSGGNAFFTWSLPICIALKRFSRLSAAIANTAARLDLSIGGGGRLALHRWVIVRRET